MTLLTYAFVNIYGDTSNNYGYDMVITSSKDIVIVGRDEMSGFVMKLDSSGNVKWIKRIGGTYTINGITETPDKNYIISGQANYGTFIAKTDTSLSGIWSKRISLYETSSGYKIARLTSGNYLVMDLLRGLIVISENGNILLTSQERTYTSGYFYGVTSRWNGGYAIVGDFNNEMILIKDDFSLNHFGIYPSKGYYILENPDTTYFIVGTYASRGILIKLNSDFNVLWTKIYSNVNSFRYITKTADENYLMVGNFKPNLDSTHIVFVKIDSNGNIINSKIFKTNFNKYVSDVEYVDQNLYILSNIYKDGDYNMLLMKLKEGNEHLICNLYDHTISVKDTSISRMSVGHIYYTGNSSNNYNFSLTNLFFNITDLCSSGEKECIKDNFNISIKHNKVYLSSENGINISLYTIDGRVLKSFYLKGKKILELKNGVYVIKAGNFNKTIVIRK